jgi:F-type H+-transporting ATPase subunit gamma
VVELALQTLTPQRPGLQVWAVGERLRASLADAGITAQGSFAVPASVQAITGQVTDILLAVIDTPVQAPAADAAPALLLFYNRPSGGSTYTPVSQRLLPLDEAWRRDLAGRPWPTPLPAQRLGSAAETLRGLIGEYVFVSLFRASAASLASENASRLAAMDRADRNIDKMLGTLHSRFHRSRQRTIDEELSDVISGFKALKPQVEA